MAQSLYASFVACPSHQPTLHESRCAIIWQGKQSIFSSPTTPFAIPQNKESLGHSRDMSRSMATTPPAGITCVKVGMPHPPSSDPCVLKIQLSASTLIAGSKLYAGSSRGRCTSPSRAQRWRPQLRTEPHSCSLLTIPSPWVVLSQTLSLMPADCFYQVS